MDENLGMVWVKRITVDKHEYVELESLEALLMESAILCKGLNLENIAAMMDQLRNNPKHPL